MEEMLELYSRSLDSPLTVKFLLDLGMDPNAIIRLEEPNLRIRDRQDPKTILDSYYLIAYAIHKQKREIIRLLVQYGASIEDWDEYVGGILIRMIMNNDYSMLEFLISLGADVNYEEESGAVPLLTAVAWQREEMVKLLVQSGANVNYRDSKHIFLTPMNIARKEENQEIIQYLMDHGALAD